MTQTAARTTSPADIRPLWRWTAALILPIGPAAVALLRFLLPYNTVDDVPTITNKIVDNLARGSLVIWLGYIAFLTLVPGAYFVGRLTRRRAPWLTAITLLLLVPGYLSLPWTAASDVFTWSAGTAGLDPPANAQAAGRTPRPLQPAGLVFVFGALFCTVLLRIARLRSPPPPPGGAIALVASSPSHP